MTPTCVAPRHVDAPRYFFILFFILRTSSAQGKGALPDFFCSFLFFPCSADHERDWPPCKAVFFGLATNALNARNNNNNNNSPIKEEMIAFETTVYLLTTRLHPALRLQVSIRNPILQ